MQTTPGSTDLVLDAMRLAEYAHRNRAQGPHHRKAPPGTDRPAYFIHLAEVGWMLQDAGLDAETVAAGYLHDILEDCDYTQEQLAAEFGNARVAELVAWVSDDKIDPGTGERLGWEQRGRSYLERMCRAPDEALALSCADKTANIIDMLRHMKSGYPVHSFTSRDHATQLAKFEALAAVYGNRVPVGIKQRFERALREFREYREAHDATPGMRTNTSRAISSSLCLSSRA